MKKVLLCVALCLAGTALANPLLDQRRNSVTLNPAQVQGLLRGAGVQALMAAQAQGRSPAELAGMQATLNSNLRELSALSSSGEFRGMSVPFEALQLMSAMQTDPLPGPGTPPPTDSRGPAFDDWLRDFERNPNNLVGGIAERIGMFICMGMGVPPQICEQLFGGGSGSSADQLLGMVGQPLPFEHEAERIKEWANYNTVFGRNGKQSADGLARFANRYDLDVKLQPLGGMDSIAAIRSMRDNAINQSNRGAAERLRMITNDPWQARTGVSKYTNPLQAVSEIQSVLGGATVAGYNSNLITAEATSLEARAAAENISEEARRRMRRVLRQSEQAVRDAKDAKPEAAARMLVGLVAEMNSLQSVSSVATLQQLEQVIKSNDAAGTSLATLVQMRLDEQAGAAQAVNAANARVLASGEAAGETAKAAVDSLRQMPDKGRLRYAELTMPVPQGRRPFIP